MTTQTQDILQRLLTGTLSFAKGQSLNLLYGLGGLAVFMLKGEPDKRVDESEDECEYDMTQKMFGGEYNYAKGEADDGQDPDGWY